VVTDFAAQRRPKPLDALSGSFIMPYGPRFLGAIGREDAAFEAGQRPCTGRRECQEKDRFFRRPLLLKFDFSRGLGYGLIAQTPHGTNGGRQHV
jgi:hypothetical protein